MRFLTGLVIGAVLLAGAAYIRDSSVDPTAKSIVNWDVASDAAHTAGEWVRSQVGWLGQQLHRQG